MGKTPINHPWQIEFERAAVALPPGWQPPGFGCLASFVVLAAWLRFGQAQCLAQLGRLLACQFQVRVAVFGGRFQLTTFVPLVE